MKIKPIILCSVLLLSVFLFSFKNSDKSSGRLFLSSSMYTDIELKLDTGGRTVSLDSAQACIDRYAALMKDHGFSNQAGQPVNIRIRKTSMITIGESFNGKNLQDWLNATAESYAQSGKTLMIKIQMGVYDMNYLNTYQPNAALRAASNNRIAIFLIPYDAGSGQSIRAFNTLPTGGTPTGGGYDLGGVQP
jgi:hypothetical protein